MIYSDIPSILTKHGRALSICLSNTQQKWEYDDVPSDAIDGNSNNLQFQEDSDEDGDVNVVIGKRQKTASLDQTAIKKPRLDNAAVGHWNIALSCLRERLSINLRDTKYRRDTRPLTVDCDCLSCRSHTRAYIHHLLKVKELLGDILLYQHNQRQLVLLFQIIRKRSVVGGLEGWLDDIISKLNNHEE